ncbi:inositol monophosphatase [Candidatus Saccharibacteria bacterium]|nr:inositol monophosphatase [Candidatus Saccharibacteria bacterium]
MEENTYLELKKRITLANYIASNAGSLITDLYHRKIRISEKEVNDFATELDKNIESMALRSILNQFPDDGFYGEENIRVDTKNGFEWVVDPIDGTNNYVRGLPLCGFQLAILFHDSPIFGLIHRPLTQEIYTATKGEGAHYVNQLTGENRSLEVSLRPLDQAIGIFDAKVGKSSNPSTSIMLRLSDHINMSRVFGVAVFDLPAVAEGAVEFLVSGIAKKYDLAAGMLLIQESGGVAYNLEGHEIKLTDELVIFSSPTVKDDILRFINPV